MSWGSGRRHVLRAFAGPALVVLLAGTAAAGPAETRDEISEARHRLKALESTISTEQARAASLNESIIALAADLSANRRLYEAILDRLGQTRALRQAAARELASLQARVDRAVAEAYIRGPGYAIETVLHTDSLAEASAALAFASAIVARNAELVDAVDRVAHELKTREAQEQKLSSERAALLSQLTAKQETLVERFAEQQERLGALARARAELGSLLVELQARLRAEELAAARDALARGTPLTFGQWAEEFLRELHAPVARNNLVVIVAWQVAEYTQARWNPLATTYPMPGATEFNGHGVRNYVSLAQGLDATRLTLRHCCYGYEAILANLARNADSMTTGEAIHDSRWCYGCANGGYVIDIIPTVERYYDRYANDRAS